MEMAWATLTEMRPRWFSVLTGRMSEIVLKDCESIAFALDVPLRLSAEVKWLRRDWIVERGFAVSLESWEDDQGQYAWCE